MKTVTTAGADIDSRKTINKVTLKPQFGIVRAGSGSLVVKYDDDNTDVSITVEVGSYLAGGFYNIDSTSASGIEVSLYY